MIALLIWIITVIAAGFTCMCTQQPLAPDKILIAVTMYPWHLIGDYHIPVITDKHIR